MKAKTKRITLPVSESIDDIRDELTRDTGIRMTYSQILNYLIHFYLVRKNQPLPHIQSITKPITQWRGK
jgi:hypothetical protein